MADADLLAVSDGFVDAGHAIMHIMADPGFAALFPQEEPNRQAVVHTTPEDSAPPIVHSHNERKV